MVALIGALAKAFSKAKAGATAATTAAAVSKAAVRLFLVRCGPSLPFELYFQCQFLLQGSFDCNSILVGAKSETARTQAV
jgi:hypothetical protein